MKVSSPDVGWTVGCMFGMDAVDRLAKGGVMGIVPAAQPCPTPVVEARERSRRADGRLGGLRQQTPGMRLARPADVTTDGRSVPRLADARVEPQVAHQLRRTTEPGDIPDDREHPRCGHEADARD